ncbi:hypothetical protein AB0O37_16485, partial [Microbacterium chocolatum]
MVISVDRSRDPAGVERVLRSLPAWFGIYEATASYVEKAARLESFVARDDGAAVGVALIDRHFPDSAELVLQSRLFRVVRRVSAVVGDDRVNPWRWVTI